MGVKRFDFIRDRERRDSWMEEASLGQYIKSADYDTLAARCQEINDKWALENQTLADDKAELVRVLGVADARILELEAALNDLLPGLILDRRYADADDDIDAMNSRIETVTSALGTTSETTVEPHLKESGPDDPPTRY